ncbi:hypothetical protein MKZ20_20295 [Psychrobacillus sp. FSL K6-2684]
MLNSPEDVFIAVFSLAAALLLGNMWGSIGKENKKTDQLGKVNQ